MPRRKIKPSNPKFFIRDPLGKFIGQFEFLCFQTLRFNTYLTYCKALQRFFSCFPSKSHPETFDICDIEDYKRTSPRSKWAVVFDVRVVSVFFNWYRDTHSPEFSNPCRKAKAAESFL